MKVALKELEPFIRNGKHLHSGKPFERFGGMRSREILGNWLVCAVNNFESGDERFTFTSDPLDGDGIIYDTTNENAWPTEHVMARAEPGDTRDIKSLILQSIELKQNKGKAAYASGKTLVVLLEGGRGMPWFPNEVAKALPKIDFDAVLVVGLQGVEDGEYVYGVTLLDVSEGDAPAWTVRVNKNFDNWTVTRVQ